MPKYVPAVLVLFLILSLVHGAVNASQPHQATPGSQLKALYMTTDTNTSDFQIKPQFKIVNNSSSAIPLSQLNVRYYFTIDTPSSFVLDCDYALVGCSNITSRFVAIPPVSGADYYLEIGF